MVVLELYYCHGPRLLSAGSSRDVDTSNSGNRLNSFPNLIADLSSTVNIFLFPLNTTQSVWGVSRCGWGQY